MKCPKCGHQEDKVIDSRVAREGAGVRRRRECLGCKHRYTTLEEIVPTEIYVIKRDLRREEFNPQKIRDGVKKALWKRPVSEEQVEALITRVLQRIETLSEREIPSSALGELVMEELEKLDQVAYVRFASIYRQFRDIAQFMRELQQLTRRHRGKAKRKPAK